MSFDLIAEIKALVAKFEGNPVVKEVVTDIEDIGASSLNFIKTQGLADLYQIALAALAGAATGTPWAQIGATVIVQGEQAGIQIVKGAEAIVLAQAQADLIAQGKLASPTTGSIVSPNATPASVISETPPQTATTAPAA